MQACPSGAEPTLPHLPLPSLAQPVLAAAALFALLLLVRPAVAETGAPSAALAGLAAWVGCPPHCTPAPARVGLQLRSGFVLDFPPLRGALDRLLGRRRLGDLIRLAEDGPPVTRQGDWVRLVLCRRAFCATEFAVLFVHLGAGELVLCWHEERWEAPRLRWSENRGGVWRTGAEGRQTLPAEGCNNRGPFDGHDWDLLRRLADG
jgi:hypothetical protein